MKFYLNSYATSEGSRIMLEFHAAKIGGRFVFSTGILIKPVDWNKARGWPKDTRSTDSEKLEDIQGYIAEYMKGDLPTSDGLRKYLNDQIEGKRQVTAERETLVDNSLLSKWQFFLEVKKKKTKEGTIKNYTRSREIMEIFLKENGKDKIRTDHFNNTLLEQFEGHLLEKYAANTKEKVIKHLAMFCQFAVKDGSKFGLDVDDIEYKEKAGRKISMTEEQLIELCNLENLSLKHQNIRDIMVVHCMIGVRVSDLFKINKTMFKGGKLYLKQQKTQKPTIIPILQRAAEILERHDWKLPKYSEQKYRDYIKEIYAKIDDTSTVEVIGKDGNLELRRVCEEISSHDMVRTFITISGDRGMPVPLIAQIVGKSPQVIYRHYLNPTQATAEREFAKAWNF